MRPILQALTIAVLLLVSSAAMAQHSRMLTGTAHNVTAGVQSGVILEVIRKSDGTYEMTGAFDSVSLVGEVTGTGRPPLADDGTIMCAQGHECILFTGGILLGPDDGFDLGTTSTFTLHLDFNAATNAVTGVYHIGLLPGFTFEQYGLVTLSGSIS